MREMLTYPMQGNELEGEAEGVLAIKAPWPSTMRTVYGDQARYETAYFAAFEGYYFPGKESEHSLLPFACLLCEGCHMNYLTMAPVEYPSVINIVVPTYQGMAPVGTRMGITGSLGVLTT